MKERQSEIGKTLSDGGQNQVRVFENARFGQVRTAQGASGEPLFCLADVCKALGLSNPRKVKTQLSPKGVTISDTLTNGGIQQLNFITEANLYRCIFQSRKAEAELFQDWVCEEVLPEIRETGGYVTTHQDDTPEMIMARALQVAQSTIEKHQQQLEAAQATITLQSQQLKAILANKFLTENLRSSEKVSIFAAVTDGSCTYFAEQAVKLLTSKVGFFIAHLKDIGGCLLRKIIKALGVEIPSVTSAKWQPLFPMPTTV